MASCCGGGQRAADRRRWTATPPLELRGAAQVSLAGPQTPSDKRAAGGSQVPTRRGSWRTLAGGTDLRRSLTACSIHGIQVTKQNGVFRRANAFELSGRGANCKSRHNGPLGTGPFRDQGQGHGPLESRNVAACVSGKLMPGSGNHVLSLPSVLREGQSRPIASVQRPTRIPGPLH